MRANYRTGAAAANIEKTELAIAKQQDDEELRAQEERAENAKEPNQDGPALTEDDLDIKNAEVEHADAEKAVSHNYRAPVPAPQASEPREIMNNFEGKGRGKRKMQVLSSASFVDQCSKDQVSKSKAFENRRSHPSQYQKNPLNPNYLN